MPRTKAPATRSPRPNTFSANHYVFATARRTGASVRSLTRSRCITVSLVTSRPESPVRTFLRGAAVSTNAASAHSASTWRYLPAKRAGRTFLRGAAVSGIPQKLAKSQLSAHSAQHRRAPHPFRSGTVPPLFPRGGRTVAPITFSARRSNCRALHPFLSGAVLSPLLPQVPLRRRLRRNLRRVPMTQPVHTFARPSPAPPDRPSSPELPPRRQLTPSPAKSSNHHPSRFSVHPLHSPGSSTFPSTLPSDSLCRHSVPVRPPTSLSSLPPVHRPTLSRQTTLSTAPRFPPQLTTPNPVISGPFSPRLYPDFTPHSDLFIFHSKMPPKSPLPIYPHFNNSTKSYEIDTVSFDIQAPYSYGPFFCTHSTAPADTTPDCRGSHKPP